MYTLKINCNQVMRLTGHLRLCAWLLMVSQVLGRWEHTLGQRLRKEISLQIQQKDGFLDIYCRFIWGIPFRVSDEKKYSYTRKGSMAYPSDQVVLGKFIWLKNQVAPGTPSFPSRSLSGTSNEADITKLDGFYDEIMMIMDLAQSCYFEMIDNSYSKSPQSQYLQIHPPCSKWSYPSTQVPGSSQVANRVQLVHGRGILKATWA